MHADLHSNTHNSAILRILRAAPVRKQDEIVRRLREEGHEVTQSSISRDLRDLGVLKAGDHVLCGDQAYGRTLRLMTQDLPRLGIETSLADPTDAAAIRAAMRPNTRMILVEVISNPTIRVADMEGIARIASETGVLLVVDNTFTTPRLYRPFEHGADIIIHSVTKLMAGHSDATLGYAVARDPALMTAINDANVTWGLTPSPFDCWLAERGLHTFDLRLDKAERNAAALAEALAGLKDTEFSRAQEVWRKKFGTPPQDPHERTKHMRFLITRGFNAEVVRRVVKEDGWVDDPSD